MLRVVLLLISFQLAFAEAWEDSTWLKLLHYQKTTFGFKSSIDSKDFFLAKNGRRNPKEEYLKFQEEIHTPQLRCKFVARTKYVAERMGIHFDPYAECKDFSEWFNLINPKGLTLVFPSVYLNNPASAFGHTLLRIDSDDPEIVRYAVNFSAQTNGESSLLYAFKGVFGGYFGRFAVAPYYNLVKKYNDYESRDIWEYKLDFTQAETIKLVEHLWELQTADIDYYYFDDNCSYHLLSLIDYAKGDLDLTSKFNIWVLPLDTVQEMSYLINDAKLRTGITEEIYANEKNVEDISAIKEYVKTGDLSSISDPKSLSLLQDYLSYLTTKGKITEERSRELSYKLYQKISTTEQIEKTPIVKEDPRKHHKYNRLSLDFFNQEIEYKPAYHNLLDPLPGAGEFASLDLVKIRLDHKLRTKKLDLVDIYSLSPRGKLIKPMSYKLNAYYEDLNLDKSQKVFDFGFGASWKIKPGLIYSLIKTTPTWIHQDENFYFGLGNESGMIVDDRLGRNLFKVTSLDYLSGDSSVRFSLNRTFPINKSLQARFQYDKMYDFGQRDEYFLMSLDTYF